MQLFRWKCTCECGNTFETLELDDEFSYGEFILRNSKDELRYLFAPEDKAFAELIKIVEENKAITPQTNLSLIVSLEQRIFAITCDKAEDGSAFEMNLNPLCPKCGSRKVVNWQQIRPIKPVEVDIKAVSHLHWDSLSQAEKKSLVEDALLKELQQMGK